MIPRVLSVAILTVCSAASLHADSYLLTVVTSDAPSPQAVQLMDWFAKDPQLSKAWQGFDGQLFAVSNPLYLHRYAHTVPPTQLPTVVLARQSGGVIYKASGSNIPKSPAALFAAMKQAHATAPPEPPTGIDRSQCPSCPRVPQPAKRPFDSRLVPNMVDAAVPDTVELNPSVNVDLPGWVLPTVIAVLALLGLSALAFLGLVVLGGGAIAFFR